VIRDQLKALMDKKRDEMAEKHSKNSKLEHLPKELVKKHGLHGALEVYAYQAGHDSLADLLILAIEGLELMHKGPAKTMAEPKSVWYNEHSGKALAEIYKRIEGEK